MLCLWLSSHLFLHKCKITIARSITYCNGACWGYNKKNFKKSQLIVILVSQNNMHVPAKERVFNKSDTIKQRRSTTPLVAWLFGVVLLVLTRYLLCQRKLLQLWLVQNVDIHVDVCIRDWRFFLQCAYIFSSMSRVGNNR